MAGRVAGRTPIIVYSGPSENSTPSFLLSEDYPLVVISETSTWLTICMHDQTSGHVLLQDSKPGDNVVVIRPSTVYEEPSLQAAQLMLAGNNLLLASTGEIINGWLPVRHRAGTTGFILADDVWGHSGC